MKTIPIPTGRLLIVPGLPKDANALTIWTGQYSLRGYLKDRDYLFYTTNGVIKNVLLPNGSWSKLGKASELTEEQMNFIADNLFGIHWLDYTRPKEGGYAPGFLFDNVSDSYASFLTFHGIKPEDYLLIENKK